jgi:hypothetical protein
MNDKDSLWPADFGEVEQLTPVAILRQQGAALGELTKNIVVGRVETAGGPDGFDQRFWLFCGPLGYQLPLLQVRHNIDLYPAEIIFLAEQAPSVQTTGADDLKNKLRDAFARPKTRRIIASLLAQSRA